jgi:YHYH protein
VLTTPNEHSSSVRPAFASCFRFLNWPRPSPRATVLDVASDGIACAVRYLLSRLHGILVFLTLAGVAARAAAQELPLGDGHVTAYPAVGKVYACRNVFRGGGARHAGPWIHGKTWNAAEKPHVAGRVMWPQARFAMTRHGNEVVIRENGLPNGEATGIFPIAPDDPAYRYDTNPNHIEAHDLTFEIPAAPTRAGHPGCLPMGMIGFTVTGVAIYNALDDAGRDANAHEVQDRCDGHPQSQGQYHYHSGSPCVHGADSNRVVGWALDGYPILGMRDARGTLLTDADLDACHGRAKRVTVNGRHYDYAYRLTQEYPYTLGCFTGTVASRTRLEIRRALGPPRRPRWPFGSPPRP